MKLIKIYGLITAMVVLSFAVISFLNFDNKNEEDKAKFEIPQKGEILPKEQWLDIIIGSWKMYFTVQNSTTIIDVTGEITYTKDDELVSFTNTLFFEQYSPGENNVVKRTKECLSGTAEGVRKGPNSLYPSIYQGPGYHISHYSNDYICKFWPVPGKEQSRSFLEIDLCQMIWGPLSAIGNEIYKGKGHKLLAFNKDEIVVEYIDDSIGKPVYIHYKRINQRSAKKINK